MSFKQISDGIYKLDIFCDEIYTSVFALESNSEWIVMDFGVSDRCAEECIIPEIEKMGIDPKYLLCSHTHFDHIGGIGAVASAYPSAVLMLFDPNFTLEGKEILRPENGAILLERYKLLNLKGHTNDGLGIYDLKNGVLLSADALQMYGIGDYGTNLDNLHGYFEALEEISALKPSVIFSSHYYYPHGSFAKGDEAVQKYINACYEAVELIKNTIKESQYTDYQKIADEYNSIYPTLPRISGWTVKHVADLRA